MSKHLKIALVDDDIPNTEVLRDFPHPQWIQPRGQVP